MKEIHFFLIWRCHVEVKEIILLKQLLMMDTRQRTIEVITKFSFKTVQKF